MCVKYVRYVRRLVTQETVITFLFSKRPPPTSSNCFDKFCGYNQRQRKSYKKKDDHRIIQTLRCMYFTMKEKVSTFLHGLLKEIMCLLYRHMQDQYKTERTRQTFYGVASTKHLKCPCSLYSMTGRKLPRIQFKRKKRAVW